MWLWTEDMDQDTKVEPMNDSNKGVYWRTILWHLSVIGLPTTSLLCLVWLVSGRIVLEKLLIALAMPSGLLWLGLFFAGYMSMLQRRWGLSLLLWSFFVSYGLSGNTIVGNWLVKTLEEKYYHSNPLDAETFDLLVVLGGGTDPLEDGTVQLGGSAGDRVMLAARLYHRGKAKRLVVTGVAVTREGLDPLGGAKAAERIWKDLGIPPSAVTKIGGRNTSEQIRELQTFLQDHSAARIGLLTSAWHLPRALRLAKGQGLELLPVPAAFETGQPSYWMVSALVPNPGGFQKTNLAVKEYLARLVHR